MKFLRSKMFELMIVLIALIATGEFSVRAQKAEMSYAEVSAKINAAEEFIGTVPYRSTLTGKRLESRDGKAEWTETMIQELVPRTSSRYVKIIDKDGSRQKVEGRYVKGQNYQRVGDGPWEKLSAFPDYAGLVNGSVIGSKSPVIERKARLVVDETDEVRNLAVYETWTSVTTASDPGKQTRIDTVRYWIRGDGMMMKKVAETELVGDPKVTRTTTVYEYENIKIEAPIP